jgi:alkylation response protein AidB-like acyl-CoA dehydrogenase
MDFSLNEDQQALQELTRKILEETLGHDRLKEVGRSESRIDREAWKELAKANLLGICIDEKFGGSGLGLTELCVLHQELGRAVAPLPIFPTLVLGALPIAAFGSKALQEQWLPQVASGETILSAALVDAADARVTARPDGSSWRLNGERRLVQAAHVAHRVIVPASTEEGATALFLVDPACEGVNLESAETTDEQLRPHMKLANVRVPEAELLGKPRDGAAILDWIGQRATLALCAMQVGVAERALEITAGYVSEREQFGRPVGSFQAVHTRAADAYVDLQAMRLTTWRLLHLMEHDEDARDELAIAKFWASEGGARVTYAAQHLHGGIGVDVDYPIHRYYLWAGQIGLHLGTGTAQLASLGHHLAEGDVR